MGTMCKSKFSPLLLLSLEKREVGSNNSSASQYLPLSYVAIFGNKSHLADIICCRRLLTGYLFSENVFLLYLCSNILQGNSTWPWQYRLIKISLKIGCSWLLSIAFLKTITALKSHMTCCNSAMVGRICFPWLE